MRPQRFLAVVLAMSLLGGATFTAFLIVPPLREGLSIGWSDSTIYSEEFFGRTYTWESKWITVGVAGAVGLVFGAGVGVVLGAADQVYLIIAAMMRPTDRSDEREDRIDARPAGPPLNERMDTRKHGRHR